MSDGYGFSPFGLDTFGSIVSIPPEITDAVSLDGCRVRVSFNVPMAGNAALTATSSYTITALLGAAVTVQSVQTANPSGGGFLAVNLTVSGTTLGGLYTVIVSGPENLTGQVLAPPYNSESFLALGQVLTADVAVSNGSITITVKDDLDREVPLLDNGAVQDDGSYTITGDYPISPSVNGAGFSSGEITLEVGQLTTISYDGEIGPAEALSYDGTVLPNLAVGFDGVEIGTGSSSIVSGSLLLSKPASAVVYGWQFEDTSGKLTASASFQAAFSIDATAASGSPRFSVSDGVSQIDVTLDTSGPVKEISIEAGGFSSVMEFDWSASVFELTVIRNSQASLCTVLIDGIPFDSFSDSALTQPASMPAGAGVFLDAGLSASGLKVSSVVLQASETIYTAAWNFVFNLVFGFVGLSGLANDRIRTKRGPLVKSWGDWTPAGPNDVEVRVNGVSIAIADVNPYTGEIFPVVPIPLFPAGMATVEVDYCWIANPIFALSGLNTRGLTLNSWTRAFGRTAETPPPGLPGGVFGLGLFGGSPFGGPPPMPALPSNASIGAVRTSKFAFSTILGPLTRPEPLRIGHTYIGYQREYSALMNDPSTLLLNNNPHAIATGKMSASAVRQTGIFDGLTSPDQEGWSLTGVDEGAVFNEVYFIDDVNAGAYPEGTAAVWYRALDLALPTVVQGAGRFYVIQTSTFDGVFTGVALGSHDGLHIGAVGAIEVSGVKHLGILTNAFHPDLESSWQIGPRASATAINSTQILISSTEFPAGLAYGAQVRIGSGSQAGVYVIDYCGIEPHADGIVLTISPALPADITLYGNNEFDLLFEVRWDSADYIAVRYVMDFPSGKFTAYVSGALSGTIGTVEDTPAYPGSTALILPPVPNSSFFGSISRRAANTSYWPLTLYSANPVALTQTVSGVYALADMTVLPEDLPEYPWFITGGYGQSQLSSGNLTLSSGSSSSDLDFEFSYSRIEPHLTNKVTTDFRATVSVDYGNLGSGNAALRIRDGLRQVLLSSLLYKETASARSLVTDLPALFFSGLQVLANEGWASSAGNLLEVTPWGQSLSITKPSASSGYWAQTATPPTSVSYSGIVIENRLQLHSIAGTANLYVQVASRVSPVSGYSFVIKYTATTLTLTNSVGTVFLTIPGLDDQLHSYRIVSDSAADLVSVFIDEVFSGSVALSLFNPVANGDLTCEIGLSGTGAAEVEFYQFSVAPLTPVALGADTLGKTFGFLVDLDNPDSIDAYKIPRSDVASSQPNSSLLASPVQMDWTASCDVRLYLDPSWGVGLYRPDLPLPPLATGDFTSETTEPSHAWVNVEYRALPRVIQSRGDLSFGSLDPRGITRSRWDDVSYRVRARPYGFGIANTGMTLNRAATFKSADWNLDKTPETRLIPAREPQAVYVSDSAVYGDRVFMVSVNNTALSSSSWVFDEASQRISISSSSVIVSQGDLVSVTFAPKKSVTKSYQCSRPIDETVTVLNQGTPVFPKNNRDLPISRDVIANPVTGEDEVVFTHGPGSLYASSEYCENPVGSPENLAPLTSICDNNGFAEVGLSGRLTDDAFTVAEGPAGPFRGSPTFRGSTSHFGGLTSLIAAGGRRSTQANGLLNQAVLIPNVHAPGSPGLALNQDFALSVSYGTQTDGYSSISDATPPSLPGESPIPVVNPNGTPVADGSCIIKITDYGSIYSRLGPYGRFGVLSGGIPLALTGFTLAGGMPLPSPSVTIQTLP